MESNKIGVSIDNWAFCNIFKKIILKFNRHEPNQVFNVHSSEGLKFRTKIRLGLSQLAYHEFRHDFQEIGD